METADLGYETFSADAVRHAALDGGDWHALGLAILADPVMRKFPRVVISDVFKIAMSKDRPSERDWKKLATLSDFIDDIGGTDV